MIRSSYDTITEMREYRTIHSSDLRSPVFNRRISRSSCLKIVGSSNCQIVKPRLSDLMTIWWYNRQITRSIIHLTISIVTIKLPVLDLASSAVDHQSNTGQ